MSICAREECGNEIHTGTMYCSRKCSALARSEKLKSINIMAATPSVPPRAREYIGRRFGKDAAVVLSDMEDIIKLSEGAVPAAPTEGKTVGGLNDTMLGIAHLGLGDYRPDNALSCDTIDLMQQNGQVAFVTTLKKAPIRTVFRNSNSWRVESANDEELAERTMKNLELIFPTAIDEILTSLDYGSAFSEIRWENVELEQLGLKGTGTFTSLRAMDFCYPGSISKINRTSRGKFNGFTQNRGSKGPYDVPVDQAMVFTYDGKFRNMWGNSYYKPMYVAWYWYEVVWRCFLRYLERQATPVVLVKAPQHGTVQTKSGVLVNAMDHGLVIGADIAKSNVAVLPSNRDDQTNQPLWELGYLSSESRTSIFVEALRELGTQILRSGLLADRVATQESSVGSYNIASVHYIMTRLDDERILDGLIAQINEFLLPKFSLYNAGLKGPRLFMKTEGLDIEEKGRLFQLLMKLADAKHPQMQRIDLLRTLEIENVPMMDDAEWEKFKKEQEEEAEKKIKQQQELMASKPQGSPFPQKGEKAPSIKDTAMDKDKQEDNKSPREKALSDILATRTALANGELFPIYLTKEELESIESQVGSSIIGG